MRLFRDVKAVVCCAHPFEKSIILTLLGPSKYTKTHTQWKPGKNKGVGVTQLAKHLRFLLDPRWVQRVSPSPAGKLPPSACCCCFFRFYLTGEQTFLPSGGRVKGEIAVTGVRRAPTDRASRNGPAVGKGMATGRGNSVMYQNLHLLPPYSSSRHDYKNPLLCEVSPT